MAVSEGQVRVTVDLNGKGDAFAHLKKTATGFDLILSRAEMLGSAAEKVGNGLEKNLERARAGTFSLKEGLDSALDVVSAFGPKGQLIAGLGKIALEVANHFANMSPPISAATVAIIAQRTPVQALTAKYTGLAIAAETAAKAIGEVVAKGRGYEIDAAKARGDDKSAAQLEQAQVVRAAQADRDAARAELRRLEGQTTEAQAQIAENQRAIEALGAERFRNRGDNAALAALDATEASLREQSKSARKIIETTVDLITQQGVLVEKADDRVRAEGERLVRLASAVEEVAAQKEPERPKEPRGGGATEKRASEVDALLARLAKGATDREQKLQAIEDDSWRKRLAEYDAAEQERIEKRAQAMADATAKSNAATIEYIKSVAAANDNQIARTIRQIGEATEYSAPGLEKFTGLVDRLSESWGASFEARARLRELQNDPNATEEQRVNAATDARKKNIAAIKTSIVAGTELAASVVKNEKAQQLIQGIGQAGLGFASLAEYDYGAAALHFISAGILGYKAFSGASGGSGAGGAGGREGSRRISALTETASGSNSPWVFQFNAPYYGNPQAAAVALWEMADTIDGTGFDMAEAS